ncbi:MAG TPA: hypothetical protein VLD65_02740, partial [Anaerolineales bacterium]|nr:hypothetical protein [Anaerolineales bacterium]
DRAISPASVGWVASTGVGASVAARGASITASIGEGGLAGVAGAAHATSRIAMSASNENRRVSFLVSISCISEIFTRNDQAR